MIMLMRHLSNDDLIRLAERPEAAASDEHLTTCARCRRQVAELSEVVTLVSAGEVPEPSPLFWDHLSQRIGAAIEREPVPARDTRTAPWTRAGWKAPALVATSAAVIAVALSVRMPDRTGRDLTISGQTVVKDSAQAARVDATSGEWEFVETVASAIDSDAASVLIEQFAHRQAEQLVDGLSLDEQTELARLIQAEMTGPQTPRIR